jgi:hypothetical protein
MRSVPKLNATSVSWRVEDVGLLEPFIAPLSFTFRQTAQWTFPLTGP